MENKVALLVFEFIPNGTLQEHLQGKRGSRLSWKQRLQIGVQTADALNYLRSAANHPIIQRDVKSANILLTEKLNVKVADFGISKLTPEDATHVSTAAVQGTMGYIDPQYYTSFQLTAKSDVYSFGVVLLELISAQSVIDFRRPPGDASIMTFASPFIQKGNLEPLVDPGLTDCWNVDMKESVMGVGALALRCLQARSKDRPNMKEVWKELQTLWLRFESPDIPDRASLSIEGDTELEDFSALRSSSTDYGESRSSIGSTRRVYQMKRSLSEKLVKANRNTHYKRMSSLQSAEK